MDKQHILNEIRRTAKANGGTPLGKSKFLNETGIKESDWHGKYWVRWGDALCDAGFQPNQMTRAYPEGILVEKLIGLTRELGHFPVEGELRLKARADSDFPSHTVFARLGSKRDRMQKIAEFCRCRGGLEDVLALCTVDALPTKVQPHENVDSDEEIGFVYLLKSGRFYKIGRSNSTGRRARELAIQLPEESKIVHSIRTDDPVGIEAYWHKRFESKRARRDCEFFELGASDVRAFKRRKFM
jgi:hypothetical protein